MSNENSKPEVSTPGKIYAALNAIMSEVEAVPKGQQNKQQGYAYRGVDDFFAALHPLLAKHKVFVTKKVLGHNREEKETKSGTSLNYSIMEVEFTYHAEDGSFVTDMTVGEAMDSGDKASNKAMSSAFKYSLMQVFAIPTKEEKDTEAQSHEVKPKKAFTASEDQKDLIVKLMKSHVFTPEDKKWVNQKWKEAKSNQDISDIIDWAQKEIKERKKVEAELEKEAENYTNQQS